MYVICKTNCISIQLALHVIHISIIQHIFSLINLRVTNVRVSFLVEYIFEKISISNKLC